MVRELADYRVEEFGRILRWPIREALIAYRAKMMQAARDAYRHELAIWSAIAPHAGKKSEPPQPPPILREVALDAS
jgi:hypothetical protein